MLKIYYEAEVSGTRANANEKYKQNSDVSSEESREVSKFCLYRPGFVSPPYIYEEKSSAEKNFVKCDWPT